MVGWILYGTSGYRNDDRRVVTDNRGHRQSLTVRMKARQVGDGSSHVSLGRNHMSRWVTVGLMNRPHSDGPSHPPFLRPVEIPSLYNGDETNDGLSGV
ncbi:hypothetical protein HAX54_048671 [Datura stramonium]|uniref:Uncharacterized protein n=1 Tax=Datura stramonium TaxID=4076 RepID=A0ABS8WLQ5_DATST|nr:hypothetical protein [Datura stramonium]